MAVEIIKTIKGRRYRYLQKYIYRPGRSPKTKSIYLGPIDGQRRKRKLDLRGLLPGIAAIGISILQSGLKSPHYHTKYRLPDPRTLKHMCETLMGARGKLRSEMTERERIVTAAWQKEVSQMSREKFERQMNSMRAEEAAATRQPEAHEPSQTAQNAPGRMEAPAAKDFRAPCGPPSERGRSMRSLACLARARGAHSAARDVPRTPSRSFADG
jgi:hypothetical protein